MNNELADKFREIKLIESRELVKRFLGESSEIANNNEMLLNLHKHIPLLLAELDKGVPEWLAGSGERLPPHQNSAALSVLTDMLLKYADIGAEIENGWNG